jgi:type IV pilus assembly protein PilW
MMQKISKNALLKRIESKRQIAGVTLIELMVSLAIGLIIALAAASAYLGTRGAAVATENVSRINETGKLALDFIGREIQTAGFFPADEPATLPDLTVISNVTGYFTNIKTGTPVAYNQGLFGCDGAQFKTTAGAGKDTCPAAVANAPDSIVINYYTSDIFGSGSSAISGHMRDCNSNPVTGDADNHVNRDSSLAARNTLSPPLPLYVSNRIGLIATTYIAASNITLSTNSLSCSGNGSTAGYQPIFEGIEDLVFRYGVYGGANSQSPQRYYTAAEVTALPLSGNLTGWQRVSAVQVCIVVRSLDSARLEQQGTGTLSYDNCRGSTTSYAATKRLLFKRFIRVFAARNSLNGTF